MLPTNGTISRPDRSRQASIRSARRRIAVGQPRYPSPPRTRIRMGRRRVADARAGHPGDVDHPGRERPVVVGGPDGQAAGCEELVDRLLDPELSLAPHAVEVVVTG